MDPAPLSPSLLATIPFLKDAGGAALRDVVKSASWYCVPSGSPLFLEQEAADTIWFVLSGSLGAFKLGIDGEREFIGHIRQGEPVGEFALIAGEPHANSVFALRDSDVLAIDRATFTRLVRRHPALMTNLARTVLLRSRQNRRRNPRAEPRVYALLSGSPSLDLVARSTKLKSVLEKFGKRVVIIGQDAQHYSSAWFDQMERDHDIVLLISDSVSSPWANLARRRGDRIWIFGRNGSPPVDFRATQSQPSAETFQFVDMVLVHPQKPQGRTDMSHWQEGTGAQRVFHLCDDDEETLMRLARVMAGTSIGLVLGGGGARAYAHVGAVRALREAGHIFDFVGGTSMGGVVAACVAMGWRDDEIERRIYDGFVRNSPLDDYILPVVSLTSGKKVDKRLEDNFGSIQIEDLALPFFCVSANLTQAKSKVHRFGSLRDSLRASIALPGILPPVVWGEDVLVDGAALDNFPVSTMRDMHRGPVIGIDVAQQHALDAKDFRDPKGFMSWVMQHGFRRAPPIAELLMRSATATLQSNAKAIAPDLLIVPELGGIQLREWKAFDRAVEAGYSATVRALKSLPAILR